MSDHALGGFAQSVAAAIVEQHGKLFLPHRALERFLNQIEQATLDTKSTVTDLTALALQAQAVAGSSANLLLFHLMTLCGALGLSNAAAKQLPIPNPLLAVERHIKPVQAAPAGTHQSLFNMILQPRAPGTEGKR